jgi:hypothetical protein
VRLLVAATAVCGLLPLAADHVAAAIRQVSTVGVDIGNCVTVACRTITYAIGQAADGDTISVAAGTYAEHDIAVNKSLTISGAGAASTTVDAQSAGRVFRMGDATKTIALSGMTITGGHLSGADGGGIFNMATLTLTNATVGGNPGVQPGQRPPGQPAGQAPNPQPQPRP